MVIEVNGRERQLFDLHGDGTCHAGGDEFVAHTLLDTLPSGRQKANFVDPAVTLSTLIGLVSEEQALGKISPKALIKKHENTWQILS